jgi:hypothetical protein
MHLLFDAEPARIIEEIRRCVRNAQSEAEICSPAAFPSPELSPARGRP